MHRFPPLLFCCGCLTLASAHAASVAEFTAEEDAILGWRIVDDGVMGGLSKGQHELRNDGILRFFGTLSLENNGGFSSLRSQTIKLDLSAASGIVMRVRGDGRSYQLRFSTDAEYRGGEVSFQSEFATKAGEWREVKLPFESFVGGWRGIKLPDKKFDPAMIRRVGLLLGDKKPGPFALEVDWIRTYGVTAQSNP